MTEDEKALRAAIAHDIRSPLSVLKGYQEMLLEFIPKGSLDTASTLDMLREGMKQIVRMNSFIDTMKNMTKLEERELTFAAVSSEWLYRGKNERTFFFLLFLPKVR